MDPSAATKILRKNLPGLIGIYHFGSSSEGRANDASDVDLAVLCATRVPPLRLYELQEECARALGKDVDLVDLSCAATAFAMQVVSEGRIVFETDPYAVGLFETRVYSSYAHLNEERGEILRQIKQRGKTIG